ncbi:hypothetical protein HZA57_06625 [Candidatus Poribacteria bacterium]|nr:hypothetical protein [Candidatus Poribacteria bacterium]
MTPEERKELRATIVDAIEHWFGPCHQRLAGRWQGGKMILQPENDSLKPKEVDIEIFFHKIVMMRESLRVLEQKINNHPKLDDEDRVQFQQYITRIYGTMTTFNILFRDEEDRFTGQRE